MYKYIKYFHINKRRNELRIGFNHPQYNQPSISRSLDPQTNQNPPDYKICDIWSMNFFEQYEQQLEENKVTKKQQLDSIKESIQREKERRMNNLLVANQHGPSETSVKERSDFKKSSLILDNFLSKPKHSIQFSRLNAPYSHSSAKNAHPPQMSSERNFINEGLKERSALNYSFDDNPLQMKNSC